MFEQDYLMRMLMQVTHYIARIMRLRQEQKPEQAYLLLGQGYEFFFGLSIDMVERMSAQELYEWLRDNGRDHEQVIRALIEYLQAHAELLESMGHHEEEQIVPWRLKKIELYLYSLLDEERRELLDIAGELERNIEEMQAFFLPSDCYARLVRYYEIRERFADAEDILYIWRDHILENNGDNATDSLQVRLVGAAFYERLLHVDDSALEVGGLPREEVIFGQLQWLTGGTESA
jgi:hypothetical protein